MTETHQPTRPLTLIEKIIAANAIGLDSINDVKPGNVVVLGVSWVLSSEASWIGINKTYSQLNRPPIHRKDRVWLAQDHTVDPRINARTTVKKTIDLVEAAAKELGLVDYYGPNYTIMHTEFCRERAQPGQVVIGSDSHTCSAGRYITLSFEYPVSRLSYKDFYFANSA
jgi:homoaconitate hydratase